MKFHYLLLFVCWLPLLLPAQTVTVSEEVSIRNDNAYNLLGRMGDRFLLYQEKPNKVEIQAFMPSLRQSWKKELKFDHKRYEVMDVIQGDEEFGIVYKYRKKGINYIKYQKYDPAANLADSITIRSYQHSFNAPEFDMIFSEDRKMLLFYSIRNQNQFKAFAWDTQNKQMLWSREFELDDERFFHEHTEILVTNGGDMYLAIVKDNRKNKMETHHYLVYRCSAYSDHVEQFAIPMPNLLTYSITFDFDNKNKNLVVAGLYSDKNLSRCNGYFSITVPARNVSIVQLTKEPFTNKLVADLEGKIITDFKGMEDVRIQDIVFRQDGGMLLFYERTKEYERRMAGAGRGVVGSEGLRYIVDYYYENLFVIALHPDGQKHWEQVLHKKQYSQDDEAAYSSYFIFKTPSALRLIFNDDIKNENTVSEYILNPLGNYDRNSVMSTENQEIKLRFRDAVQVASNEIIVPSETRNRLKLVQVVF